MPSSPYCMIYLWWETERENYGWSLLGVKGSRMTTTDVHLLVLYLFMHWLMKQNANKHLTHFPRSCENCSNHTVYCTSRGSFNVGSLVLADTHLAASSMDLLPVAKRACKRIKNRIIDHTSYLFVYFFFCQSTSGLFTIYKKFRSWRTCSISSHRAPQWRLVVRTKIVNYLELVWKARNV